MMTTNLGDELQLLALLDVLGLGYGVLELLEGLLLKGLPKS